MTMLSKINHEGKQYIWTGKEWFQADNYLKPPTAIIQILNLIRTNQHSFPQSQKEIPIKRNCENDSTFLSDLCVICNQRATNGIPLCDGSVYHSECYTKLCSIIKRHREELDYISARVLKHKERIKRTTSLGYKIRSIFFGDNINISTEQLSIINLQEKEVVLAKDLKHQEQRIKKLWDYWLEYPPDWEERRRAALDDTGVCERCGCYERLHVHHIKPVAKGGSHCRENLEVLCVHHHGAMHGRDFTEREFRQTSLPSAYAERLAILQQATAHNLIVHFSYRKFNGERSTRYFSPQRFKRCGHSLCIEGWCYLRNAKRTFAIQRMSGVTLHNNLDESLMNLSECFV